MSYPECPRCGQLLNADATCPCCVYPTHVAPAVADQPSPAPNDRPAVWDLVAADFAARDRLGQERYGTRLQPFNGRDTLRDLFEELMDACVYARALIYERDGK